VVVVKTWEDLSVGVKGQSRLVIARSLRNVFEYGVQDAMGGKAPFWEGDVTVYQLLTNSEGLGSRSAGR